MKKKNQSLGFTYSGGYLYRDNSKKYVIEQLNEYGNEIYGDLVFNDWTEWHLGINYTYHQRFKEHFFLIAMLNTDLILGSRSKKLYTTNNGGFLYAYTPKAKAGFSLGPRIGIEYEIAKLGHLRAGISYGLVYGFYPAEYEVRFGFGDPGLPDNFQKYQYAKKYLILRSDLSIRLLMTIEGLNEL